MLAGLLLLFTMQAHALSFDRDYEGIYEIAVRCKEPAEPCGAANFSHVDRLTIIDSQSTYGTWVTFAGKEYGDVIDTFIGAAAGPGLLRLSGYPRTGSGFGGGGASGRFAYFDLEVDPAKGELSGNLIDARSMYPNLVFSGRKIHLSHDLNHNPSLKTPEQIAGSYRGTFLGKPGRLTVTMRPDRQIIGYFALDGAHGGSPSLTFNYTSGSWDPETGLLHLIYNNPRFFALGEMVLAYHEDVHANAYFEGFQFTTFADNAVALRKIL